MNGARKLKIYQDEAKARQTTHWDWDYLPAAQIERLRVSDTELRLGRDQIDHRQLRSWRVFVGFLSVCAAGSTVYLLGT